MAQKTPYTNFHSLNLDWIIKRIKNVYNDENPPPYPVRSVNGQVGNVHLTGDDIPVSPNDTTPVSVELDGKYTKPTGGIPAADLAPGVIPDPTSIIDDTAGAQDYNKTWSAHKLFQMEADTVDLENWLRSHFTVCVLSCYSVLYHSVFVCVLLWNSPLPLLQNILLDLVRITSFSSLKRLSFALRRLP